MKINKPNNFRSPEKELTFFILTYLDPKYDSLKFDLKIPMFAQLNSEAV